MPEQKLTVVARIKAKKGNEEEVKRELLALVAPTRTEAGCLGYDLHQSTEDPALFLFYENWTSRAALDEHFATPHLTRLNERAPELLAEPVEITFWEMI